MRFSFVGCNVSPSLKKLLQQNQYTLVEHPALPPQPSKGFDLVAIAIKNETQLKGLSKLRSFFPNAWLCLIPTHDILEKHMPQLLSQVRYFDDVWAHPDWEPLFLFALERMTRARDQLKELSRLEQHSQDLVNKLEKDIRLASKIQRSLLPSTLPEIPGIQLQTKFIPSMGPGGNYFDIFSFGDKRKFGILIADANSHGLTASLLSILLKLRADEFKTRFPDSTSFVSFLAKELTPAFEAEGSKLHLLYGVLDRFLLHFDYTVAGDLKPFLWRLGAHAPLNKATSLPIGEPKATFTSHKIDLKPGDLMFLYTLGLEKTLGAQTPVEALFKRLLDAHPSLDPLEIQNELLGVLDSQKETSPPPSDITFIQLGINGRTLYVASGSK